MSARGAVTPGGWIGPVGFSSVPAGLVGGASVKGVARSLGLDEWVLM